MICESPQYRLRFLGDDGKQDPRRAIRTAAALFPGM
jgi:hypothetical protein